MQMQIRKAQALFLVLFLLAVLGVLSGALTVMWQADIQARILERDGLIAFYLAQAGIENAKIWARYNPGGPFPYNSAWLINLNGGRYRFTVTPGMGNVRILNATGQALDASGNPLAERQISLQVQGIEFPINPANDSAVAWAWQEI